MKKKKMLAVVMSAIFLVTAATGCQSGAEEKKEDNQTVATAQDSDKPYDGTEIRVIFANHNWTDAVIPELDAFTEKTGIKVKYESYAEDQLSQKLAVELTSGSSGLDVMMTRPLQEIKMFEKNGWVYDLKELLDDPEMDQGDFIPSALASYQNEEGSCFGVPLITERQILYYRKDLLEAANVEVPTTMDELMSAAEKLNNPEEDTYGIVSRGLTAAAVTQFSGYLYGCGGSWMDGDKAAINTPEAVKAFTYYGDMLRKYGPPGVLNMHWQQAAAIYSQGKVAMYTDADSLYNSACGADTLVADKTAFAIMPTGKAYNICAWGLSIAKNTKNEGAAKEFVKWAASKEIVSLTQSKGNSGARSSVWDEPESNKSFPEELVEVIKASTDIGVETDRPQIISVGKARDVIGEVIVTAINGDDVQAAADKANAEFQKIIDEDLK